LFGWGKRRIEAPTGLLRVGPPWAGKKQKREKLRARRKAEEKRLAEALVIF